jgi:endonuclease/exonuclease/phosphatase family metal-dependent hydrolase
MRSSELLLQLERSMSSSEPFVHNLRLIGFGLLLILTFGTFSYGGCREPEIVAGTESSNTSPSGSGLQIVSLNLAREENPDRILHDLKQAESLAGADVWLFQEAAERSEPVRTMQDVATSLHLNYVFAPVDFLDGGKLASGLAILSRYPILEPRIIPLAWHNMRFHTRCRIALSAQIAAPSGTLHVYNVHLDTRITLDERLSQIMPVLEQASSQSGPVLVGGDFNSADVRWVWNLVPLPYAQNHTKTLQRTFLEQGFASPLQGSGPTINALKFPLHLDWIFPRDLQWNSAGVATIRFSDHNAVWVRFDMPNARAVNG